MAAETENQARDAVGAIKVEYEVLPHVATEALSMAEGAPKVFDPGNVRAGRAQTRGKPVEAMATAEVSIEGTYSVPMITHVCLETHGLTVRFEGNDKMQCWASTQNVAGVAGDLAGLMKLRPADVTVFTDYMGGGFGSKFGADIWGKTAAELSKMAGGRPVKLFLDRVQEHLAAGNRPSASAHIKLGAKRDGMLVAMIATAHGTGGVGAGGNVTLPYVYSVPNTQVAQSGVLTNFGCRRGPCGPPAILRAALTEGAMDDLAEKLGMDPLEFRLKNLLPTDFRTPTYEAELKIGAELIGWSEKRKPRRPERCRSDQAWSGRGPASVGRRRRPWQTGLVHDQLRRVG